MSAYLQRVFKTDELFTIEIVQNHAKLFYGANLFLLVNLKDKIEIQRAVVQLKNIGVSTRKISEVFNVSRQAIEEWYLVYKNGGLKKLEEIRRGPKKITSEIETYIIHKFYDLNFCKNYKKIICEGVENHFHKKIHEKSVIYILGKHNIDISINRYNKKGGHKKEKSKKQRVENLGLLFIFPFLQKFNLVNLFSESKEYFKNKHYTALAYIYSLILFLSSNMIQAEENIKNYTDKKLGIIIGEKNIPCVKNFRYSLKKIINSVDMKQFQLSLCKNYFIEKKELKELYIDGHFFPYHGFKKIFKGYNPIRRLAMKGRTGYFINNIEGRPFFYILSDGYKGFREYIREIAENLGEIAGKFYEKTIILVFDRGGCDEKLIKDISKYCKFICWKIGKLNIPALPDWKEMTIEHQGNKYGEVKEIKLEVCERIIKKEEKIYERHIWIKKGEKISSAYSNDISRSLEELTRIITSRWGAQENIFKSLKNVGIDKISSYKTLDYSDNWLLEEPALREVKNPEKLIIIDKISICKKEINKIKKRIGDNFLQMSSQKVMGSLEEEIEIKLKELTELISIKEKLPDKILITNLIKDKNIQRLDNKKKAFMDIIKILSYNVQQDIVNLLRPVYKNQRDINMFVREIFRKSGELEIKSEYIKVTFEKYHSKIKTKTLKYLCKIMNDFGFKHPVIKKKVVFNVI